MTIRSQNPISFSVNQLLFIGLGRRFDSDDFSAITKTDRELQVVDGETLFVRQVYRTDIENRFVTICFEEGEKYPYSSEVLDTKSFKFEENPRSVDEIELTSQFFMMVDVDTQRIYISNQRKRHEVESWLNNKLGKSIAIKPLIAERDFLEKISAISEISLTVEPNLFSGMGDLSSALTADINGYGAETATLKLNYRKKSRILQPVKERIEKILGQKESFKHITIVGRTIDGFDTVFNTTEIVHKISIGIILDEKTKMYDRKEVFSELVKRVAEKNKI